MRNETSSWLSGISFLAGLWLIISPFVLNYTSLSAANNNDITVGIVVAVLSAIVFFWGRQTAGWLSWIVALVGLWELAAPFILGYSGNGTAMINDIILGIIVIVFSGARALAAGGMMQGEFGRSYTSEVRRRRDEDNDNT